MPDFVSDEYVRRALDKLIDVLGVKEDVDYAKFESIFREKEIAYGLKAIALQLGLPIDIRLEYGDNFIQSEGLVKTDSTGRGVAGIIAQVMIPHYLPRYGSAELINYPIKIFIDQGYRTRIPSLMTIIVHELSHIVLHSLRYEHRDDEIYTDLVGPLLGLTSVVEKGRIYICTEWQVGRPCGRPFRNGYLSDGQFDWVKEKVRGFLQERRKIKAIAEAEIAELKRLCTMANSQMADFRNILLKVDKHPRSWIPPEAAARLVAFHQPTYLDEFLNVISDCDKHIKKTSSFINRTRHYAKNSLAGFEDLHKGTEFIAANLLSRSSALVLDIDLIKKNLSFRGRLSGQ